MAPPSKAVIHVAEVQFVVDDGQRLVISDPCYVDKNDAPDYGVFDGRRPIAHLVPAVSGQWRGTIEVEGNDRTGGWGERVSILRAEAHGYSHRYSPDVIGFAAVDSGQMYAGCESNLPLDYDRVLACYNVDPSKPFGGDNYSNALVIAPEGGIVSSTGYGDGSYPVYVWTNSDGLATKVEVRFLEEDVDEDEYYAEDEDDGDTSRAEYRAAPECRE